jgi:hypothetical protein
MEGGGLGHRPIVRASSALKLVIHDKVYGAKKDVTRRSFNPG